MSTFIGRDAELEILQGEIARIRETGRASFVWMRGRRRVGKSRLVQELCDRARVRYCFYQAPQRSRPEALAEFVEAVRDSDLVAADGFEDASYDSWSAALRASVQGASAADPAIVVIDEMPYLTERDTGFAADLQKAWDRALEASPVLLICIGSDVRMMEELVGQRSPLHGRPTRELRVPPLSPAAVSAVTAAPSPAEGIERYLVVGGFPLLAASWPRSAGLREFLEEALRDDQTPFATTALRIMASEFERGLRAAKAIEAIGHGETGYSRIQSRSGVKGNTLTDALDVLVEAKRLVAKDLPYAVPPGKKAAKYTVADPYLRFWLRFVGPHMAELSRGRSDLVIDRIMRDWSVYRGRAVEPVVRAALERLLTDPALSKRLGGARHVGSWWRRDHAVEVDLVGGDAPEPTRLGFVGSIKWHESRPFAAKELRDLAQSRAQVPGAAEAKLVAVSRAGIESDVAVDASFGPADLLAAW